MKYEVWVEFKGRSIIEIEADNKRDAFKQINSMSEIEIIEQNDKLQIEIEEVEEVNE